MKSLIRWLRNRSAPWLLFVGLGLMLPLAVLLKLISIKFLFIYLLFLFYALLRFILLLSKPLGNLLVYLPYLTTIVVSTLLANFASDIKLFGAALRISVTATYAECRESAKPVGDLGSLNICSSTYHDNGLWYTDIPYTEEIVYDSTGEITLKPESRSPQWQSVYATLSSSIHAELRDDITAERIVGSYYRIVAY